ncbi:MAG TPA: hypothetical protein VM571_11310, partial [Noviherbaspirillum sp.]|nr:hypothetical protein [Noviherbaspirillum sp.]
MHSPVLAPTPFNPVMFRQLAQRIGPLSAIILMHIGLFYALQSGLQRQATPQSAAPKTVYVSFVTPEQPKPVEAPKVPPAKPKTVPVVKKSPQRPPPPLVDNTPSEQAIT